MSETQVNIPLLRKAVEWAEAEAAKPEAESQWRQAFWITPADRSAAEGWGIWASMRSAPEYGRCGTCYCIAGYVTAMQVGPTEDVPAVAASLLGIDDERRGRLFDACNTIEDVRRIAEDIAGERL